RLNHGRSSALAGDPLGSDDSGQHLLGDGRTTPDDADLTRRFEDHAGDLVAVADPGRAQLRDHLGVVDVGPRQVVGQDLPTGHEHDGRGGDDGADHSEATTDPAQRLQDEQSRQAESPRTEGRCVTEDGAADDRPHGDDRGQVEAREARQGALAEDAQQQDDPEVEGDAGDDDSDRVGSVETGFHPIHVHLRTGGYRVEFDRAQGVRSQSSRPTSDSRGESGISPSPEAGPGSGMPMTFGAFAIPAALVRSSAIRAAISATSLLSGPAASMVPCSPASMASAIIRAASAAARAIDRELREKKSMARSALIVIRLTQSTRTSLPSAASATPSPVTVSTPLPRCAAMVVCPRSCSWDTSRRPKVPVAP